MNETQYRNMTIDELVANWECDDSFPTYKDELIQKLLEERGEYRYKFVEDCEE